METQREQELYLQELHNFVKLTDVFGMQSVVADLALFYPDLFENLRQNVDFQSALNDKRYDKKVAALFQASDL